MREGIAISGHSDGALLHVWVVPGAKRTEVVDPHDGMLRVRVAAPPEGGKANKAVAALLEEALGARSVRLVAGARSRRKQWLIVGMSREEVTAKLS